MEKDILNVIFETRLEDIAHTTEKDKEREKEKVKVREICCYSKKWRVNKSELKCTFVLMYDKDSNKQKENIDALFTV